MEAVTVTFAWITKLLIVGTGLIEALRRCAFGPIGVMRTALGATAYHLTKSTLTTHVPLGAAPVLSVTVPAISVPFILPVAAVPQPGLEAVNPGDVG